MTKSIEEISKVLDSISDVSTDADQLDLLDKTIKDIADVDQPLQAIQPLLRIFERFPEADGFGVFWSILHRIEATPGFEPFLLASVKRKPSEFTVMIINRMINGGITTIKEVDLFSLLADIEANMNNSEMIRNTARGYLEYQRMKNA